MSTSSLRVLPVLVAGLLLLAGCDQGPVGPQGPPGPPGPAGAPGAAATTSFIVDFIVSDRDPGQTVYSSAYDAPEVTQGVVDVGIVMAYFREQGTWTAMPYTYGVESPDIDAVDYTVTLGYAFELEFVEVFYELSNPVGFDSLVDREVKFVILYGNAATVKSKAATIDWSDYDDVARKLDLDDDAPVRTARPVRPQ